MQSSCRKLTITLLFELCVKSHDCRLRHIWVIACLFIDYISIYIFSQCLIVLLFVNYRIESIISTYSRTMKVLAFKLVLLTFSFVSCRSWLHMNSKRYSATCDLCKLTFDRESEHQKHLAGRRHTELVRLTPSEDQLWQEYSRTAPHWTAGCKPIDLLPIWSHDELSSLGLKYRTNCLHPTPTLNDLTPYQRARVWRYSRDILGLSHYSEMAGIVAHFEEQTNGHMRVKELFESFEIFHRISLFILDAKRTLKTTHSSSQNNSTLVMPTRLLDLAAGHGFVGLLLAYRFADLDVHLFDHFKRPTFDAFVSSFEQHGVKR